MKLESTDRYEAVTIGDIVEDGHSNVLGVMVRIPGFYHATVLWQDGDLIVCPRLALRPARLSYHQGGGTVGMLQGWFTVWDDVCHT